MASAGTVSALWRYPVKSMLGERIEDAVVSDRGVAGDRAYALVDVESGKVVSAKRPRYWARMLDMAARFEQEPLPGEPAPPVRVRPPDGSEVSSADADVDRRLSDTLGRKVSLVRSVGDIPMLEEVWIEEKNAEPYGPVIGTEDTERLIEIPASIGAPPGTFFDYAAIHMVTTATLARLAAGYPEGNFDPRRFRPNVVLDVDEDDFVENGWVGSKLTVGDARFEVLTAVPRCVMTTLPQGDLPKDRGILRTVAQLNAQPFGPFEGQPCVGVYAEVVSAGTIKTGDAADLAR